MIVLSFTCRALNGFLAGTLTSAKLLSTYLTDLHGLYVLCFTLCSVFAVIYVLRQSGGKTFYLHCSLIKGGFGKIVMVNVLIQDPSGVLSLTVPRRYSNSPSLSMIVLCLFYWFLCMFVNVRLQCACVCVMFYFLYCRIYQYFDVCAVFPV